MGTNLTFQLKVIHLSGLTFPVDVCPFNLHHCFILDKEFLHIMVIFPGTHQCLGELSAVGCDCLDGLPEMVETHPGGSKLVSLFPLKIYIIYIYIQKGYKGGHPKHWQSDIYIYIDFCKPGYGA